MDEFIEIGKILKPKGFDGSLRIALDFEIISDIVPKAFFIEKGSDLSPFLIDVFWSDAQSELVRFKKISTKEEAVLLNFKKIFLPKSIAVSFLDLTEEATWIDYKVYDANLFLGTVVYVYDNLHQQTLEIQLENKEEFVLIPVVQDWIRNIDLDLKIIDINLPEGILDINKT
jgi:16S rRNA processing protein RimM